MRLDRIIWNCLQSALIETDFAERPVENWQIHLRIQKISQVEMMLAQFPAIVPGSNSQDAC